MTAITIDFNPVIEISDEQFYQLCIHNPETKFKRLVNGEIVIMPPQSVCSDCRLNQSLVKISCLA